MIINKLNISSFGKIHNHSFEFTDKINVIYGNNESGKTTLLSFIRYMLYGLSGRKSHNNVTFEEKYQPWDNTAMSGSMNFSFEGKEYLVSRTNGVRKEINVIDVATGETAFKGEVPGESIYGVGEGGFLKTYYLSGATCAFGADKNDDIVKGLTNLADTGDEAISYSAASKKINSDKKITGEKVKNAENEIYTLRKKLEHISMLKSKQSELESKLCGSEHTDSDTNDSSGTNYEQLQKLIETQSLIKLYQQAKVIIFVILLILGITMFATKHSIAGFVLSGINVIVLLMMMFSKRKLKITSIKINKLNRKINNEKFDSDKSAIYKEIGAIESELSKDFSYDDICSQIDCLERDKRSLEYKIKVLDKAGEILDDSYSQMKSMFSPLLNKRVSEIFSDLTNGKYSDVVVSDDFSIKTMSEYDYKISKMYSMSAYEAMYLSLRLALCDIFDNDEKLPVFLDDCFISYDDERANHAIKCIEKYSKQGRQIIFCTCHKRELEMFKKLENVNIIDLTV